MAFRVLYDDITYTFLQNRVKMGEWSEQMSGIANSLNLFIGLDSFKGTTAENMKNYLADVHFTILISLGEVLSEFQSRFLLYKDGYCSEIDGDIHAELTEGTLDTLVAFFPQSEQNFVSQHSALMSVSNSISDLMGIGVPSDFHILDSYSTVLNRVKDLKNNTIDYEAKHYGTDLNNFQQLLSAVKNFINDYLGQDAAAILNYQAGSAVNMGSFSTLENAIIDAYTTRDALTDELIAASENEAARMEILEAEWAAQRKEQGKWQWIAGAGAVIVGTICIVATAGCATPLVVAGFVAGGSAIAYGAAEMYEGEQEMYYGSIGDPYTSSFNPIRDTIFGGNQAAYDTWGFISTTAAGILIPAGQGYTAAVKAAETAGTNASRAIIARSIAYEVGKDVVSGLAGAGATYLGTEVGTELFGADAGKYIGILSGLAAGFGTNAAISRLDKALDISGLHNLSQPKVEPIPSIKENHSGNGATKIINADGTIEIVGEGTVTQTIDNRPYLDPKNRPSFRKGVVEEVWETAKDPDGLVRDPHTGEVINWEPGDSRKNVWDMGHKPDAKYSDIHAQYVDGLMTPKEFRNYYNDPSNYWPELPSTNRSHLFE